MFAVELYLSLSAACSGCHHTEAARRVLGVVVSADLSLEKRVINVSVTCFHHLCRLRHISRMLTAESAATLVHAFVTSCVDYCNVVLAGALKVITNKLLRVMNTAARVLTGTRKFDCGLTQLMHDNFHWLDVAERVKYKVIVLTRRCLIGTAPRYLAADCVPVSEMADVIYAPLLVISSSCRRTVWTHVAFGRFLYSVWDYGTLCLDCCVTLATALLALDILWRHWVTVLFGWDRGWAFWLRPNTNLSAKLWS